jgi:hypothetical protein
MSIVAEIRLTANTKAHPRGWAFSLLIDQRYFAPFSVLLINDATSLWNCFRMSSRT